MAHLLISATNKSSGKTSISIGLAAALKRQGMIVQSFKKGPDYIDPLWLAHATGKACYNLDFFTMTEAEIQTTFSSHATNADICLIEGNKGLYDGLDVEGNDSSAALARLLSAPVILVIDTQGITRGVAPLIRGYLDFEPNVDIKGIILNKVAGPRHESKLRTALEYYTDIPVLGTVRRDTDLEIAERHLGLIPANETSQADKLISKLAGAVASQVNLNQILDIARTSKPYTVSTGSVKTTPTADVKIAIAQDAAFGFYYQDDLEAFSTAGAQVVPFDTLNDSQLPDVDGLFIGGGFPETQMKELSANYQLREDIKHKIKSGMPVYAECGGAMYLSQSIEWRGEKSEMVGVIPADAIVHERPVGRGYMVLEETGAGPWPASSAENVSISSLAAHEFHHASLEKLPDDQLYAFRVVRGEGLGQGHDGLVMGNLVAGFAHLRQTQDNLWVHRFVNFVRTKK